MATRTTNTNPNPNNPNVKTTIRKTQVVTLYDRQRRMIDFYNLPKTMYIALGKQTPWSDPDDPDISDTYPPMPLETSTEITEMIGMQRIQWKKFAKVFVNPTSDEKDGKGLHEGNQSVYYKGLYYEVTDDIEYAKANGFTSVMMLMMADRDEYFPVDITYRQVGLYYEVDHTDRYLTYEQYMQLPQEKRGHLAVIENLLPISRQLDQLEKIFVIINF